MENLLYSLLGISIISASLMVISARNPIHSVLYLILVYINTTVILIMWNVEFIAMLLLIVYVGAIAILFLFVVMMLNIKVVEITENQLKYLPIGVIIGFIFLLELLILLEKDIIKVKGEVLPLNYVSWNEINQVLSNIKVIGNVLYTEYSYFFVLVSLILLVGMIGAIVLTESNTMNTKKQDMNEQINKDYKTTIYQGF